jgi:hypothetical protein
VARCWVASPPPEADKDSRQVHIKNNNMRKSDFTKKFLNKIVCGNAVDVMKKLPDGSV